MLRTPKIMIFIGVGTVVSPAGHGPPFSNGVAPQIEAYTDYSAGQEDSEHHQGADQQVEKGVKDGAAGKQTGANV